MKRHSTVLRAMFAATATLATLACAAISACSAPAIAAPPGPPAPPPPTAQTVQVSYCRGLEPIWVAFQDGDGPWTQASPTAAGGNQTFQYGFQTNRGGIATVMLGGGGLTVVSVLYGAPAELATAGITKPIFCGEPVSKTLLGTVIGLDTDESAVVSGGLLSRSQVAPGGGGAFALKALPSGPHDLVAARTTRVNGQTAVTGFILRRDVDLPDSTMLPVLDFASAEAFPPALATLTIDGIGPEGATAGVRLITGTTEVLLFPVLGAPHEGARPYPALPLARLRPSDLHALSAAAAIDAAGRIAQLFFRSPSDRTLTLPAPLVRPTIDLVATAPLRPRARFEPQGDYDRTASMTYQQGTTRIVTLTMTAAYAALTVGGYDLVVPDLSGVPRFDPAWALHSGVLLLWTAGRTGGTLGLGVDAIPVDGTTQRSAFDTDVIPES